MEKLGSKSPLELIIQEHELTSQGMGKKHFQIIYLTKVYIIYLTKISNHIFDKRI